MEYMGTKEAAERWGYAQATISKWCREGVISTAEQDTKGSPWRIPINEKCPGKRKRSKIYTP
ncbi:MAG: helix-turn-helix domain-containing protein [Clostridiales bacterium]|nr:helix-turn-helix domain-containing protein [Clostridiales bacterium]